MDAERDKYDPQITSNANTRTVHRPHEKLTSGLVKYKINSFNKVKNKINSVINSEFSSRDILAECWLTFSCGTWLRPLHWKQVGFKLMNFAFPERVP